jgi:SAM-dependent methyltransferase
MIRRVTERPRYKTWIRTRPIVVFSVLVGVCLLLTLLAIWNLLFLVFLIPAAIFGYILLIVGLSRWRFSEAGGDYQDRVHQLLVARVSGGSVLDVGCGSGHLLAEIARAHPDARLVGLDFWGDDWEYSQALCEANFEAEGFGGRASFVRGSASKLPEEMGTFDSVVSCLTFHEVGDVEDKTVSLREALGRVFPGGSFAFMDLFDDRKFYPDPGRVTAAIVECGGQVLEDTRLAELLALPFPLQHKRVLGHARLIAGRKTTN